MNPINGTLAAIGGVGTLVGLLMIVGIVPTAITGTSGGTCTGSSPSPAVVQFSVTLFTSQTQGVYPVILHDNSCASAGWSYNSHYAPSVGGFGINWGDGNNVSGLAALGNGATHNYLAPGAYIINETLLFTSVGSGLGRVFWANISATAVLWVKSPTSGSSGSTTIVSAASVTARFSYTVSQGNVLNVHDLLNSSGPARILVILFTWGDGSANSMYVSGSNLSHTYQKSGNYSVQERVSWTNGTNQPGTFYSTSANPVSILCSGGNQYCGTFTSTSSAASTAKPLLGSFGPISGLVTFGSVGLLVAAVIPGISRNYPAIAGIAAVLAVVGYAAGVVFGH